MKKKRKTEETYDEKRKEIEYSLATSFFSENVDRAPHHGVLAQKEEGVAAETHADALELVRPNVVGVHDQDLRVLPQMPLEILVELHFPPEIHLARAFHGHHNPTE